MADGNVLDADQQSLSSVDRRTRGRGLVLPGILLERLMFKTLND